MSNNTQRFPLCILLKPTQWCRPPFVIISMETARAFLDAREEETRITLELLDLFPQYADEYRVKLARKRLQKFEHIHNSIECVLTPRALVEKIKWFVNVRHRPQNQETWNALMRELAFIVKEHNPDYAKALRSLEIPTHKHVRAKPVLEGIPEVPTQ